MDTLDSIDAAAISEDMMLVPASVLDIDLKNMMIKDYVPDDLSVQSCLSMISTTMAEWRSLVSYYKCAMMEIETKFKVLNEEFSMQYERNPIENIKSRIKSPESLVQKMMKKGIPMDISSVEKNINDVAGIRVVCSFLEDVDKLAECLLQQDDITLVEVKDYIRNPKPNGYRGLHLIVEVPIFLQNEKRPMKVEIQLRTIAMDFWASLEHRLCYKKDIPADISERIRLELFECAEKAGELDKKMQEIRTMTENVGTITV